MSDFQLELLAFIKEVNYDIADNDDKEIWDEQDCCLYAYHLAIKCDKKLPEHLHNRIIFAEKNYWQQEYVRYLRITDSCL